MVEHVIGNDGVVSPILTSGTSFLLSPFYKGFFYAFFQAIFNTNRHLVRQLSRQRFLTAFTYIRFPVFLPERIYKKNKTFARMQFYFFETESIFFPEWIFFNNQLNLLFYDD